MAEIEINDIEPLDQYTAVGAEPSFDYNFPIFASSELKVLQVTDLGVVSTLTEGVDYDVSGVGLANGGTMTFDLTAYPSGAPAGYEYTLYRDVPVARNSDFLTGGDFKAVTVNRELDKIIMMIQQNELSLKRSLSLQLADTEDQISFKVETPGERAGKVLQFGSSGNEVEGGPTSADIENAAGFAADAAQSAADAATSETNAETAETNAAASALQAAASAAEGLYNEVQSKVFADSPIAPVASEEGNLFRIDTSGGNVVVNLDTLANYGEDMKFAFVKETGDANTITVNRGGTDTINGATSLVITEQYETHALIGDTSTGLWLDTIQSTSVQDGTITFDKLAASALASQAEAEAGLLENKLLTPLRVKQAIEALASTSGAYLGSQALTGSSGTYTPTAGTTKIKYRLVGASGGGGGAAGSPTAGGNGGSSSLVSSAGTVASTTGGTGGNVSRVPNDYPKRANEGTGTISLGTGIVYFGQVGGAGALRYEGGGQNDIGQNGGFGAICEGEYTLTPTDILSGMSFTNGAAGSAGTGTQGGTAGKAGRLIIDEYT